MKSDPKYTRSLELLDQFISETSSEELAILISKYQSVDIKGPTFDEYLGILQNEFESIIWNSIGGDLNKVNFSNVETYHTYYSPPISQSVNKINKKDSVNATESFFLL